MPSGIDPNGSISYQHLVPLAPGGVFRSLAFVTDREAIETYVRFGDPLKPAGAEWHAHKILQKELPAEWTQEEFDTFIASCFCSWKGTGILDRAWKSLAKSRLIDVTNKVSHLLQEKGVSMPENLSTVSYILSNGHQLRQRGHHTMGPSIVITQDAGGKLKLSIFSLLASLPNPKKKEALALFAETAAHELFHVISRAYPHVQKRLYDLLGFEMADGKMEALIQDHICRNPDVPQGFVYTLEGPEKVPMVPLVLWDGGKFDGSFERDWEHPMWRPLDIRPTWVRADVHLDEEGKPWVEGHEEVEGPDLRHWLVDEEWLADHPDEKAYVEHPEELLATAFSNWLGLGLKEGRRLHPKLAEEFQKIFTSPSWWEEPAGVGG